MKIKNNINNVILITAILFIVSCGRTDTNDASEASKSSPTQQQSQQAESANKTDKPANVDSELTLSELNLIASDYVRLVLRIGQFDKDFVDAYYGPEEFKPKTTEIAPEFDSEALIKESTALQTRLNSLSIDVLPSDEQTRVRMLQKQMTAVHTKLEMLSGTEYSFDEEALLLYDAKPPSYSAEYFDQILNQLATELPGEGLLSDKYNEFVKQFIIPKDRLDSVFQTAIDEARKRTAAKMDLPENENFVLEYVNDKSWSGYNYYQGNGQSLIQINTDFPIFIDRAIDLACHEGYPGHHVFNALLEDNLVNKKNWLEYSVYPLFSPQSLIAEGSANYGIDVAFPGETRIEYEKSVLFPLAGINPDLAEKYYRIQGIRAKLNYAGNEAARQYLNGEISREQAAAWIEKYLLFAPDRALQRTRFIDQYRSYVINYNLGKDIVANYMERELVKALEIDPKLDPSTARWQIFEILLSTPNSASMLESY